MKRADAEVEAYDNIKQAVKPAQRVRIGDVLAALGLRGGLVGR